MTSVAAAVLVVGAEPYEECLASLSDLDQIYVLTDEPSVLSSVRSFGATGRLISRPLCIEEIGTNLLSSADADWLLLIDPDERLICADFTLLKSALSAADYDLAGYGISYRMSFLGHVLHCTYKGLRKTKLVRPKQVQWPTTIHSLPTPTSAKGRFIDLPESVALIESELAMDVRHRLARHAQWALIESSEAPPASVDTCEIAEILAGTLEEYFSTRSCDKDGAAGILNGLLHLNKSITSLLFRAAAQGLAEDDLSKTERIGRLLKKTAADLKRLREDIT